MEQVTATRSELLARRARLDLALRGRDLLDEKRHQLMEEFRRVADLVLAGEDEVERAAGESRQALALAGAFDGPEAVLTAAAAGRSGITLTARAVTVMGVRIAEVEFEPLGRPRGARGYTLEGTSAHIDEAASRFETELELVLELAARELRLRRLVDAIGETTRRVNALEHVVVPELEREVVHIRSVLDERERQDRFRLERAKSRRRHEGER